MKKGRWYFFLAALMLGLGACATNNSRTPDPDSDAPPVQEAPKPPDVTDEPKHPAGEGESPDAKDFAAQITDTIEIEGMEETITLSLYEQAIAPFLTYIPEDFIAEETSSEEGDSFWFYANYEGVKREDVYLQFYLFADTITEEPNQADVNSTLAQLLGEMEAIAPEQKIYTWSLHEYQSENGSNYAMLGKHEGRYFVMVLHSRVDYSEGFYPRANKIIEHFYWTDTQKYLTEQQ